MNNFVGQLSELTVTVSRTVFLPIRYPLFDLELPGFFLGGGMFWIL